METYGGFASSDLDEMLAVKLPENVTIVIEAGGSYGWQREDIGIDGNCRLVYDSDGLRIINEMPGANMGDAATLESFLRYCNDNYPADNRAVFFWNHGGGSVAGLMFDERYGYDSLSLDEMRTAFEATTPPSKDDPPYELIGFDACLMATVEMTDTLNGFARWMVASQEVEPAVGWNYSGLLQALADDTNIGGRELGVAICDSYFAVCEEEGFADEATLSLINMGRIDALLDAYENIGVESLISACENIAFFGEFGRAARSAVNYGGNNSWYGYSNMVDLGDLVRYSYNLLPEYGQALLDALDDCVEYTVGGKFRDRASGISCYYSYNSDLFDFFDYATLYSDSPFRWFYEYKITGELSDEGARYVDGLLGRLDKPEEIKTKSIPSMAGLENHPVISSDDGYAILDLGSANADQLTGVYVWLAYYDVNYDFVIMLGRTNDIIADWDSGVFSDNFYGYWACIDGIMVFLELVEESESYKLFNVPIMLNGEEYSMSVAYTYATEEYEILGARRGIDDNGMADKNLRLLMPGDLIEPVFFLKFDMNDPDEELTVMPLESIVFADETRIYDDFLGDGIFILLFEMVDILDESYLSEGVAFVIENGEVYLLQL